MFPQRNATAQPIPAAGLFAVECNAAGVCAVVVRRPIAAGLFGARR